VRRKRLAQAVTFAAGALVLWIVFGFVSAQTACAHDPRFACSPRGADNPIPIRDPAKSWAYYGRLSSGQSGTYAFEVKEPLRVPISLLIEEADAANPARPALQIENGRGADAVQLDLSRSERFHEPFSGIDYLSTPDHTYVLSPGLYRATVAMKGGNGPQRYVFAIGEAEKFGIAEIPYVFGAVYRVKTRGF
jgi:hypothetical protein